MLKSTGEAVCILVRREPAVQYKLEEPPQKEHARSKACTRAEKAGYLLTGNYAVRRSLGE